MKPYYSEDGITIYHGDMRDIFVSNPISMIWTDPPYAFEYLELYSDLSLIASRMLIDGGHLFAYAGHVHLPEVISRLGRKMTYWWTVALIQDGNAAIMWTRGISPTWKPILWYRKNPIPLKVGDISSPIYDSVGSPRRKASGHPWEQADNEARKYIAQLTHVGDTIFDPFMGSGTTMFAARAMERKAIGIEIEEKYCEIAAKRLAQKVFEF